MTVNERDATWKRRDSRIFERQEHDHYVDEEWCSRRLFDVEPFANLIWDPACGWGRIVNSAITRGKRAIGTDIVDRSKLRRDLWGGTKDFLSRKEERGVDIVTNPPFDLFREFAEHALSLSPGKVAMIWLWRRLPAARWLSETPLSRVWLMTPRPSMPSGEHIASGGKVGGGTQDFCWLVWDTSHQGGPTMRWLHRDGQPATGDAP